MLALALVFPSNSIDPFGLRRRTEPPTGGTRPLGATAPAATDLSPYKHLGAWVDMFNEWPWDNPGKAVGAMARRGVTTLFLETSNYRKANDLYRPTQMGSFVEKAHAKGLQVVAWYVPGFDRMRKDRRRSLAAIDFRSPGGEAFDSFALDIEATAVADIETRNARAVRLSSQIREHVGPDYTLGAIVPEANAAYWPSFPYSDLVTHYDVFLPMAYYTHRVSGRAAVEAWTADNIRTVRQATGRPRLPVHVIGGLGGEGTVRELKGFVATLEDKNAKGGSFYDFPITTNREWEVLAGLAR